MKFIVVIALLISLGVGIFVGIKIEDRYISRQIKQILESQKETEFALDSLGTKMKKDIDDAYYGGLLQAYSMELITGAREDYKYWRFIDTLNAHDFDSSVVEYAFKSVLLSLDRALNIDKDITPEEHKEFQQKAIELKKKVLERLGYQYQ